MYIGWHTQYENEPQDSTEDGEILDMLRDCKLLKENLLQGVKQVLRILELHG
jgi:hypothetical protein